MPPARASDPRRAARAVAPSTTHGHQPRTGRTGRTRRTRLGRHRRRRGRFLLAAFGVTTVLVGGGLLAGPAVANLPWGALAPPQSPSATYAAAPADQGSPGGSRPSGEDDRADRADRGGRPATASPRVSPVLSLPGPFPSSGPGTFVFAASRGAVLGTAGTVRRFHVGIEKGVAEDLAAFAATVDQSLGDPRGWTASGRVRLQRVPAADRADFTVYLATPGTARKMCARGYVDIRVDGEPYTSCRAPGKVILNLARWRLSVPDYVSGEVPLAAYRQYMVNHEVGHQLGHGHELCPGKGRPAPVMQQQTLGLHGCVAYPWPYLNGKRYAGPSGSYG